jgi:hypothetical protein
METSGKITQVDRSRRARFRHKTKDYVNKAFRCSDLSSKVRMESEMWTPSGQVKEATQEHLLGPPHRGERQILILHPQDPDMLAKNS